MKLAMIALVTAFATTASFAQAVRVCPTEKLTCKLEKAVYSAPKTLLAQTVTEYDGANSDEPSIEPAFCSIRTSLEDNNGVIFFVNVDEQDQMTNIFLTKKQNPGSVLAGDTAFNATTGKAFYYRYNDSVLTCTLK